MGTPYVLTKNGVVNANDFPVTVGVPSGIIGAPPVTLAPDSRYDYTALDRAVLNAEGAADAHASFLGISPDSLKAISLEASIFTAGFTGTPSSVLKAGAGLALRAAGDAPSSFVQKKTAACRSLPAVAH